MSSDAHAIKSYPLRMEASLRDKMEQKAKESGRSLQAEITKALHYYLSFEISPEAQALAISEATKASVLPGEYISTELWHSGVIADTFAEYSAEAEKREQLLKTALERQGQMEADISKILSILEPQND